MSDKFTEIKIDTQKEIARLVQERANLYHQIETVREEYECLKVVQATGITDYQVQLDHASKVKSDFCCLMILILSIFTPVECKGCKIDYKHFS
jgi:hypothetical protein